MSAQQQLPAVSETAWAQATGNGCAAGGACMPACRQASNGRCSGGAKSREVGQANKEVVGGFIPNRRSHKV
jgi:hypothetical protein